MQKPTHPNRNINDNFSDDDMGINFLANTNKSASNSPRPQPMNMNSSFQQPMGFNSIPQFNPVPPINVNKISNQQTPQPPSQQAPSEYSDSLDGSASEMSENDMSIEDQIKEKRTLLFKLKRYEKKGYKLSRNYGLDSSLEDLRGEYESIRREANLEQGLQVSKNLLISSCSLIEYLNGKFDPMDIVLEGWSEEINDDVDEGNYDEVLEELYYKYYEKVSIGPEIKLITMLGGSAIKFHMAHTLLKTMVPDAETLLKQNPNLKNDIANLVNKNVPGINNLNANVNNMMFNGTVGGLGPNRNNKTLGVPKREMKGPSDVDQILRDIEKDADARSDTSSNKRRKRTNVLDMNI